VSINWQQEYSSLKDYIAKNPQIEISEGCVILPDDVRSGFYQLFDAVNLAILEDRHGTQLAEAKTLSNSYKRAAEDVKKSLALSEIKLPSYLRWFLDAPADGLVRPLFNRLFDLLKGRIEASQFEQAAAEAVEPSFAQLFRAGYEKWALLSILNLLSPDTPMAVPLEEIHSMLHDLRDDEKDGIETEVLPPTKPLKTLSLGREGGEISFLISDIIVHSARTNRYVAITGDIADAVRSSVYVSDKREWLRIRELGIRYRRAAFSWPDMVILTDDQLEDIGLVADFSRFCRPDIIVECQVQPDWWEKGGLERVKKDYDFLKPRLGSYVISRHPVPEAALNEGAPTTASGKPETTTNASSQPSPESSEAASGLVAPAEEPSGQSRDIHILTVGFDQARLAPIAEALSRP
jgi:hypothetical protein